MKPETLQALIVDDALGALSVDVTDLLHAYLETDATAARAAREWRGTVDLARRALPKADPQSAPLPPPRLRAPAPATSLVAAARFDAFSLLVMSLVLVVGLAMGRWLLVPEPSSPIPSQPMPAPIVAHNQHPDTSTIHPSRRNPAFWSVSAFVQKAQSIPRPEPRHPQTPGPLRRSLLPAKP